MNLWYVYFAGLETGYRRDVDRVYAEQWDFAGLQTGCRCDVDGVYAELWALMERRKEIRNGKPLTDFDKILKAIMTVPNIKESEK